MKLSLDSLSTELPKSVISFVTHETSCVLNEYSVAFPTQTINEVTATLKKNNISLPREIPEIAIKVSFLPNTSNNSGALLLCWLQCFILSMTADRILSELSFSFSLS